MTNLEDTFAIQVTIKFDIQDSFAINLLSTDAPYIFSAQERRCAFASLSRGPFLLDRDFAKVWQSEAMYLNLSIEGTGPSSGTSWNPLKRVDGNYSSSRTN